MESLVTFLFYFWSTKQEFEIKLTKEGYGHEAVLAFKSNRTLTQGEKDDLMLRGGRVPIEANLS
jgi:hypothetical protein